MEILRRLQSLNDFFLHIIEHIQNISLTEFRETRIIFNLMNKLISCNDHSGSTITDFFDQIVASIFDKTIEGIVKRLAKTKTIHNGPTIFCDVMRRSIIDDCGPTKRTKCIFQNFCSSMRYSSKRFLIFITIYYIQSRFDIFINGQTIDSNI